MRSPEPRVCENVTIPEFKDLSSFTMNFAAPEASKLAILLKNNQSADRAKCPMTKEQLVALPAIEAPVLMGNSPSLFSRSSKSSTSTTTTMPDVATMTNDDDDDDEHPTSIMASPHCTLPRLDLRDKLRPSVDLFHAYVCTGMFIS